ncbi:MAG: 50S ribosomal protein L32e [Methanomassiliicoccales archaeon]|jgi:large subunit ribosomal protein L32e|nr:50S ribosomal protein L32e [Methanomassiliicoccales archaeon]MDD1756757.1 50S ribosomal protein L32e [Methanomassiliicoccales archaeon]
MSPAKKQIKEISDLPYYKEEYGAQLKAMGIQNLEELLDALNDEKQYKVIVDELKGVGEKKADHWIEVIEEALAEGAESAPAPEPEAKVEEKKEPEADVIVEVPTPGEVVEKGEYVAERKPELTPEKRDALAKREEIASRRPHFKRGEWFRFKRLGVSWHKPRGIHNKMRRHYGYRPPMVSIGYRGPKEVRGYHSSGFQEVMVHNPSQLEKVDAKTQAVRVGGGVGYKKRLAIEKRADELGIRVLNRTG